MISNKNYFLSQYFHIEFERCSIWTNWKSGIKCIGFGYLKVFHFLISVAVFDKTIYIISQINILYSPRSFFPLYYLLITNRTMSGVFSTRIQNKNFNYNNLILKLIDSCLQANEILIFIDFLPDEGHPRNVPDEGHPRNVPD